MQLDSRVCVAISVISVISASPVLAAEGKTDGSPIGSAETAATIGLGISAQRAIDAEIRDRQGEDVGTVHDIILGTDGQAQHIVVSVGGYFGVGDKLVALPYHEVTFARDHAVLVAGSSQDLEQRPAFPYPEERVLMVVAGSQPGQKTDDMEQYLQGANQEMEELQKKMNAYLEEARRKGSEAAQQTQQTVEDQWSEVQQQWQRLENATQEAWEGARRGYERAREDFKKAWNEAASDG